MNVNDIKKVLIIGSGTMGQQIGLQCALHGYDVVLYDIKDELLDKAMLRIQKIARRLVRGNQLKEDDVPTVMARITATSSAEKAGSDADLVSESIPEDPDLKGKVFGQFNAICPVHTIFTTNTSSLLPSQFAAATGRPERFAALHFHDAQMAPVVDIMPHPGTAKEIVDLLYDFSLSIKQIPIVMHKENNGYVFNAMFMMLLASALTLAARDVASIEDIDRSFVGVMRSPLGPFALMDQIGIDTVYKITDYWANVTNNNQGKRNAAFLKGYVDQGHLGSKTGRGFYTYPDPAFLRPDFLMGQK